MARLYCLIFLLFSGPVFAYPASFTGYMYSQTVSGWNPAPTPQALCDRILSANMAVNPGSSEGGTYNVSEAGCSYSFKWNNNTFSYNATFFRIPQYSCPSGGELSGNECLVPSDPCELLADMCSGSQGKTSAFSLSGKKTGVSFTCMSPLSFGADPLPGCTKGCMAQVGGFTTSFQSDDGNWVTQGTAKYSGSTCDPSVINDLNSEADPEYEPEENPETSNPPDPSCPGGFKGEFNGVSVCVPPKGSSGVTELEEKDNGDGTKTNTKTEVKCENGKCEVTKTSTTTNTSTGGTVSSSSVTTTVDKAAYCSQNKTTAACKNEKGEEEGNGKFGGSCSAGFTCEGDALQCAIAKEQHKRNCEMGDDLLKTDEYKAWQTAKAWDGKSVTGNLPGNREHTISLNVGDDFIGSGSCPSDKTIEIPYGLSFTIPFSAMCEWLRLLGEGFVIVAYIVGALIIIRRQS